MKMYFQFTENYLKVTSETLPIHTNDLRPDS